MDINFIPAMGLVLKGFIFDCHVIRLDRYRFLPLLSWSVNLQLVRA